MKDPNPLKEPKMDANTTTDLVTTDAELDTEEGSDVAKTLAAATITTMVAVGAVVVYNRVIKPRVTAFRNRKNEDPEVVDAVIVETPETAQV
jgi:hypothetical protein